MSAALTCACVQQRHAIAGAAFAAAALALLL